MWCGQKIKRIFKKKIHRYKYILYLFQIVLQSRFKKKQSSTSFCFSPSLEGSHLPPATCCAQACPTPWSPTDRSPPGSSVHGISQARILEWAAMPSFRGSTQLMDRTPRLLHWQADSLPPGKPLTTILS